MSIQKSIGSFLQVIFRLLVGVLTIIAILLTIGIAIAIAFSLIDNSLILIILSTLAIGIFYYIWKKKELLNADKDSYALSYVFFEVLKLSLGLFIFFSILVNLGKSDITLKENVELDETVVLYIDSTNSNFEKYYLSQQTWLDFKRSKHSLPFKVNYNDVIKSNKNRTDFKITYQFSWGSFYKTLADNDQPLVEELAQTFYQYQKGKNMNRRDFAELMISAIQDIPYSLILDIPCDSSSIKPCYGEIKLGVFAPAEFVSNLTGDCDTRTVLLFTLLSRFNYDIAILNSEAYRHSVLGINIPSTGKFKSYNHAKYYFVETTARGCPIGYLHQDFSDINKWDFALIHNVKS